MENSKYSEIHLHHQFNIKKWLISIFLLLILSTPCLAKTQAHVVIQNQATASYFNPATGVGSVVLSNIAEIQVAAVYSFSLVEDHIIKAGP
ncbi:membrane protein, partial [Candidatus Magnetomorum sp. HK-1]